MRFVLWVMVSFFIINSSAANFGDRARSSSHPKEWKHTALRDASKEQLILSASYHNRGALYTIAVSKMYGINGFEIDYKGAKEILEKLENENENSSMDAFGELDAFSELASLKLIEIYFKGLGVSRDINFAKQYFKRIITDWDKEVRNSNDKVGVKAATYVYSFIFLNDDSDYSYIRNEAIKGNKDLISMMLHHFEKTITYSNIKSGIFNRAYHFTNNEKDRVLKENKFLIELGVKFDPYGNVANYYYSLLLDGDRPYLYERNYSKAIKGLEKIASRCNEDTDLSGYAANKLGRFYEDKLKNNVESYKWHNIGSFFNDEFSKLYIKEYSLNMSTDQITIAQKASMDWLKKHCF